MTNFLLWNTNKKAPDEVIARLVQEYEVDVLLLIERPFPPALLVSVLNRVAPFQIVASHRRFQLLTRFDSALMQRLKPVVTDDWSDYWHLKLPDQADVLVVGIHGYNLMNHNADECEMLFSRIAENVRFIEGNVTRHKRSIVFGDFNANPFESAVGSVRGLHAIQLPLVAGKHSRPYAKGQHEFFYNPMWARFGSGDGTPSATYYYYKYKPHEIFWHMLDQVVLRPALLPLFPEADLKIIGEVAGSSLLKKNGTPDPRRGSDHLPLFFRLDLQKGETNG